MSTSNNEKGVGQSEELPMTSVSGEPVGSMHMAPHRSFKMMSLMKDASGHVVAAMLTCEPGRPVGMNKASVAIYGLQPRTQGQQSECKSPYGDALYKWAIVTRKPFSNTADVTMQGDGCVSFKSVKKMGMAPPRWTVLTGKDDLVAIVDRQHEFTIAPGVDPGLIILITVAQEIAIDEVFSSK